MTSHTPGKHPKGFVKQDHHKPKSKHHRHVPRKVKIDDKKKRELLKKARNYEKKNSFKKKFFSFLFWAAVVAVVYFFWSPIKFQLLRILQLNPVVWEIYSTISREIAAQTLLGLLLTSFLGALFFVSIPVELVFLFYLTLDFTPYEVIGYIVLGNMLGMLFNYFFGLLLGPRILQKWLKKKYHSWQKTTDRFGGFLLIFGNIIPFPIELITVFIGGVRYSFFKFIIFTLIGKIIKFLLLYFGYMYFSEELTWFWNDTLWPPIKSLYDAYIMPLKGLF